MNTRPKILIVDDEPFNVDYLEQELDDLNFQTISAANGREALEQVAGQSPDVILLDIMMPVMDGFEVLRRLKAEPAWRDIPVVIISALTDMDSVVRGIESGADDYLPKPFNPTLLSARINAGLARKRLRDLEKMYLQSLERELEIGHRIQSDFLPGGLPAIEGWEMSAYFCGAREVAGDYYDVFTLAGGRLGFFVGDVTDKGVGSALYMALYRSLLRAFMNAGSYLGADGWDGDPAELLLTALGRTNRYVCRTHEGALFSSLFAGVLDPATGKVTYVNAGHNPPKVLREGSIRANLVPSGPVLGVLDDADYEVCQAMIEPGEILFVYSDGVEDTLDGGGAFFGEKNLIDLITVPARSAAEMVERVSARLAAFRGNSSSYDDVTVLAIKRQ
jgi:serine phosphatase RsbU (regulator of sigma subunit)